MTSVHDIAAYILKHHGPMTAWKLHKLVYYCQAWSLVWDDKPLFQAQIEAWDNGPAVRELYRLHRGGYMLGKRWPTGDPNALTVEQRATVDAVLTAYGKLTSQQLVDLTHREGPWKQARATARSGNRPSPVISLDSLADYYGSLSEGEAQPV